MTNDQFIEFHRICDELASDARELQDTKPNEAQTCYWLLDPFLRALGYPTSAIVPQYSASWASATGAKVDYALLNGDREPLILVEAKALHENLDRRHASQLAQYFANTDAGVGILTNGAQYEVYLDKVKQNVMDEEPFFQFDLRDSNQLALRTMARLSRLKDGSFDKAGFEDAVREWQLTTQVKPKAMDIFQGWYEGSNDELSKFLATGLKEVGERRFSTLVTEWFVEFVNNKARPKLEADIEPTDHIVERGDGPIPLPEWQVLQAPDLPDEIIFPDTTTARINNGYDVPVEVTRWLLGNAYLNRAYLPIATGKDGRGKGSLVSTMPTHPDGRRMRLPKEVSGVFVDGAFSAPDQITNAIAIITRAGQEARDFGGRWAKPNEIL